MISVCSLNLASQQITHYITTSHERHGMEIHKYSTVCATACPGKYKRKYQISTPPILCDGEPLVPSNILHKDQQCRKLAVTLRHSKDNTKHFEPNTDHVLPKYSINYIYIILDVTIQHIKAHHNDLCWTIEFGIQWDIMRWQITHHYDITSPPWVFKFTSSFIVCSTACQCKHGRKHQSSKTLIFCGGKPRLPGGLSAHKASNTVSLFIPNI